jgi:hypothetical protein
MNEAAAGTPAAALFTTPRTSMRRLTFRNEASALGWLCTPLMALSF